MRVIYAACQPAKRHAVLEYIAFMAEPFLKPGTEILNCTQ
jgi:hypothetical protein